jgi:hypothetical protein
MESSIFIVVTSVVVLLAMGWIINNRRLRKSLEARSRPLDLSDRERFLSEWKQCQALFVDDPAGALEQADELLVRVLRTRGYAANKLSRRITDIAAVYPQHAERYQQGREVLERARRSPVTTASLRKAFLDYRDFFDELIGAYEEELQRAS